MKNLINLPIICLTLCMLSSTAFACNLLSAQVKSQDFKIIKNETYCVAIVNTFSEYRDPLFCPLSRYEARGAEIELTSRQCADLQSGTMNGVIVSIKDQLYLD